MTFLFLFFSSNAWMNIGGAEPKNTKYLKKKKRNCSQEHIGLSKYFITQLFKQSSMNFLHQEKKKSMNFL